MNKGREVGASPRAGLGAPATSPAAAYRHPLYAQSLSELGEPHAFARSGGFVLIRAIPGTSRQDATGCYPLFACADWARLPDDLEALSRTLVSLTVVADPFGAYDEPSLRRWFPDRVLAFKSHRVADLTRPLESFVSSHHRRYARAAARAMDVDEPSESAALLEEWTRLYSNLVRRHDIRGPAAFSRTAFAAQLQVPGLVAFRARRQHDTIGIVLFYVDGEVAYYHLGAYDDEGYRSHASFALFWTALKALGGRGVRWADLGAGAGLAGSAESGLDRFKRGWSTGSRSAFLCGRIYDRSAYDELVHRSGPPRAGFFPAYRSPLDPPAGRPV